MSGQYIYRSATPEDLPSVRELFKEYRDWLQQDICFAGFEAEIASLPGDYQVPDGSLLVVEHQGKVVGCGAMRRYAASMAEIKRFYLRPVSRGSGAGRQLLSIMMDTLQSLGYQSVVLETLPVMAAARQLYSSVGFIEYDCPDKDSKPAVICLKFEF